MNGGAYVVLISLNQPDDWDEDAPYEIPDEDAVKPEGWLDDEPELVADPGQYCATFCEALV